MKTFFVKLCFIIHVTYLIHVLVDNATNSEDNLNTQTHTHTMQHSDMSAVCL